MILAKEIQDRINTLRADNTAGASALTEAAGEILMRVVDLSRSPSHTELRSRIIAAGKAIIKAQPAMAPLYTLVNHVLGELAPSAGDGELGGRIKQRARGFVANLKAASEAAARRASTLVSDGAIVVTHSRSSAVEEALLHASRSGKGFSVICTESRPMAEGRGLAESLSANGISTTLVIDAAAPSFIARGAQVMVGADALSVHGLINKIGTRTLALTARRVGIPFQVVATTQRFLPPSVPLSYQELKSPQEIVREREMRYSVVNLYFDRTPLEDITTCVTEDSVLEHPALYELLESWHVAETLDLEACG